MAVARSWINTPFLHHHHLKGYGCDCIGLVAESFREAGFSRSAEFAYPEYGRSPRPGVMAGYLNQFLVPVSEPAVGDVAWMKWKTRPMHLALIGNYLHREDREPFSIIHAVIEANKVVETRFDEFWRARAVKFFRAPELM
jgi:cell wall-associated NlpC family hydrolase